MLQLTQDGGSLGWSGGPNGQQVSGSQAYADANKPRRTENLEKLTCEFLVLNTYHSLRRLVCTLHIACGTGGLGKRG